MALNCATRSCPPVAAYDPERLDEQLDSASRNFVNGGGALYEPDLNTLRLSPIFKWYAGDFGRHGGVLDFVRRHAEGDLELALDVARGPRVRWQDYDWSINA